MSRPPRSGPTTNTRERLRQEFSRAAPLREIYPGLAELRVEFEFQDNTARAPSAQTYAYFPPARGFFRFACPCHSCSGEFDLTGYVSELAAKDGGPQRSRSISLSCTGQRAHEVNLRADCTISAHVRVSATLQKPERPA